MKNKLNIISIFIFTLIIALVYKRLFDFNQIIGGDWPFLFKETLREFPLFVPSWNTWQGNGLGGTNPIYFLQSFENLTIFFVNFLHIPWIIIYKIFWFGLFVILSLFSSIYLFKTVLSNGALWLKLIAALVYITNTYILMLIDGGQMGVALAYAVAPFVLARFIKLIDHIVASNNNFQFSISNFKLALLAGLALSFQVLFDPRLAYISMIAIAIYMVFEIKKNILNILYLIFFTFIIPSLVTFLLHVFWILPLLIFSQNLCERFCEAYKGTGIVNFLSFSTFSQSFSLLQANWFENIFGKVTFMKPEFLIIPVLAYSSFLFVGKSKVINKKILFFILLGISGAFLAKGTTSPFGGIYLWLFKNFPGFGMFRDSTKFYLLTSLSYSVLISFSIYSISRWLNSKLSVKDRSVSKGKNQKYLFTILFLLVVSYWGFLIRPAILEQLRGTFKKQDVPKEYVQLKDFLSKQPNFFRTLWVPRQQRFTFFSNMHPSVEAGALFNATSSAQAIKDIKEKGPQYFSELSIKYIIVPYDNLGEIFQKDNKYDQKQYLNTVKDLRSISWLKKNNKFGKIEVFEIYSVKDHFWLVNGGSISYRMISPTHYFLNISSSSSQKLIFSERYNQSWIIKMKNKTIKSQKTSSNLNSFMLEKGNYDLEIIFLQDKVYNYGRLVSIFTLLTITIFFFKYKKRIVYQ